MTTRERNYRKHPHTASFLQKFHSAGSGLPASTEASDERAVAFVQGRAPRPVLGEILTISGWKVRTGPSLVSEKQAKWMISIAQRPSVTAQMRDSLRVRLEQGMARTAGSAFIDRYKGIPTAAADAAMVEAVAPGAPSGSQGAGETPERFARTQEPAKIADGRYAIEEDGVLKFFRVKNGRKAGYVFLDVQASDDWHPVRNVTRIRSIIAAIAEVGEHAAMVRYGHELGVCGRCGRTLTDEASRRAGIGPICINK